MFDWLNDVPVLLVGVLLFAAAIGAGLIGRALRALSDWAFPAHAGKHTEGEGYIVSAVLGLLALLTGFTLSLALERFETRRVLVLQEANAIGTTYLRVQMLGEPHRTRLSQLLLEYTDNRIALANAAHDAEGAKLLAKNDRLLTDFWAAIAAAFDSVSNLDYSTSLLETANNLVDLDATRKAARGAHVPAEVFVVLVFYLVCTAAVFGYVILHPRNRVGAGFALVLLIFSLLLIIDLDRPTMGGIRESQASMERLRASLKAQPPAVFDRWHKPADGR